MGQGHHLSDLQQGKEKDGGHGQEQVTRHNRGHGAGERGRLRLPGQKKRRKMDKTAGKTQILPGRAVEHPASSGFWEHGIPSPLALFSAKPL